MANPRFIQAQSFTLQASGQSAGDTSITVQSFLLSDGVTPITTAMLGDQCYATLEPNNGTQEESIQFTGVTQNANGSATLTGVSSVGFVYPYTVTSGLAKSHAGGVTLVLSNDAGMYGNIISYVNGVVASGAPTASDTTAGITKVSFNQGSLPRARSTLVSQQSAANMTLLINSFSFQNGATAITFVGKTLAYINGALTSTFVAPVSNPRYDLIVYRPSLTDCTSITGTEAASPSLPTATSGDIVLASIYHRVGETSIKERDDSTNGYIKIWYEPTLYNPSTNITTDSVTNGSYDQSQTTSNGTVAVGESNVTTKKSLIAEKFVPTISSISGVSLWKIADTGTFTGTVKVALQADTSGSPSGSDLASATITNAAWLLLTAAAEFTVSFGTEYETLADGSPYWIVVTPSTSDTSNHPNLGINTAGGYASGVLKYNNSSDGWVTVSTSILYFKENMGILGKLVKTQSPEGLIPVIASRSSIVAYDATGATQAATTTETTVFSKQLPGGFFSLNSGLEVEIWGNVATTDTAVKLKYNGSVLASYSTSLGGNDLIFHLKFIVQNNNSLSAQVAPWIESDVNQNTATREVATVANGSTTTIDLSQPGILSIAFKNTTNTGGSYSTYLGSTIKKIA